jgi:hypothetical protein
MTAALFMRPLLFHVSDDRLAPISDIDSFDADNLRAARSEPAQGLNEDCEGSGQPRSRCRRCQNVAITTMSATNTT